MIERIARAARAHGDKAVVVPISRLDDLRRDIAWPQACQRAE